MSRQEGKIARMQLDANGNVLGFRRMDPVGGSGYLFINPFILDPNNNEVMYVAGGTKVWRNDSLSQIPLTGAWDTISTGWFQLPDTVSQASTLISALAVAPSNSSRLYVGTNKRKVYRVDGANTFSPVMTDITYNQFSGSGYVTCIAVDPSDADKVIVVFSNYGVYSIFYSTDAGATFAKSAGNLELNQAGSGNAPSIRWLSILPTPNGNVYLAATSIGIYGTNELNGLNTVWANLSPNEIGYMVVDMIDARSSDGYVVAGTHGAGVYSANITDTLLTGLSPFLASSNELDLFPNPADHTFRCRAAGAQNVVAELRVFNAEGKLIRREDFTSDVEINTERWPAGVYYVSVTRSGRKQVEKLVVQH